MKIEPIAYIHNCFDEKFGIPRQSGIAPTLISKIVFTPKYRIKEALRGISDFSHLWLIWQFSENLNDTFRPTVRPPRLGGNTRMGVFATRSPFRPNNLGLSSVKLIKVENTENEGTVLFVAGADLLDKTPIYDIKPYLAFTDAHPDAVGGFADGVMEKGLRVNISDELIGRLPSELREGLLAVLSHDPRPSYQNDPTREYVMSFAEREIHFFVDGDSLTVSDIE